ncbi:hypothetical protein FC682_23105 [Peribacillus simplex]|uniref:hypothetical protein n=1 Tax=Peribacillus simplex TaxID=1478 RepID=UPI0010BEDC81|nr:hypothetical protein [Peribacillus simplex]TKH01455.1 hypothetical protein FC682_23105 [Peribacillus simplex]
MDINSAVKEIIKENTKTDNLYNQFQHSNIDRYKKILYRKIGSVDSDSFIKIKKFFTIIDALIPLIGAVLGVLTPDWSLLTRILVWSIYLAFSLPITIFVKFIPDDLEKFNLHLSNLKLISLSERLASKIALFGLINTDNGKDDVEFTGKVSDLVRIENLSTEKQNHLKKCLESSLINHSRETSIIIEEIELDNTQREKLQDLTYQIVNLSELMFEEKGFSAKLYLRVKKELEGKELEILTSFSSFPMKGITQYGTSWVKTRGMLSIVWDCLEKGGYLIRDTSTPYYVASKYESVLAICLPGRIGVLTIQAEQNGAFDNKVDYSTYQSVAFATRQLVNDCMGWDK